jgi:sec-independent protein translocase protein TatA
MHVALANILGLYPDNWLVIAILALLLFGRKLPEMGRSLGKGIIEFKKGLQGVESDIDQAGTSSPGRADRAALPPASAGYKFDPYTGQPLEPEKPQMRFDPYTGKPLGEQPPQTTSSNT